MGMKVPKGMCHECLAPCEGKYCPAHKKASKFRATRTGAVIDGRNVTFDSKREERRFSILSLLQTTGEINLLTRQPRFQLHVAGKKICTYVADSSYFDLRLNCMVIEDAKGVRTAAYKLKKKLFEALTGYRILEV